MRTIILAVLFGLLLPAVTMAAPSNTNCKFRVLSSGPIAFTKNCDADTRSSISKAVKTLKTPHTIREDLKSIKGSAESFYEDHCARPVEDYKALAKRMLKDSRRGYKVKNNKRVNVKTLSKKFKKTLRKYARVNAEKATPTTWKMCYANLPSHKQMQQMMVPNQARRTFVWHKCSDVKNRHDFVRCAWKAASNEDGAAQKAITKVIEAYLKLRLEKEEAKVIIQKKTGGCELAAFGKLKCASSAGLVLAAILMFLLGRLRPQLRITIGVVAMVIGMATCVSNANAACSNPKLIPALTKVKAGTNLRGESVKVKMPRIVSIIVAKCELQESQDLSFLKAQKKDLIKAYDVLAGQSAAMVNYCKTLRGTENINNCFEQQRGAEKALNLLVKKAQDLYWDRYDRVKEEKRAAEKAAESKAAQELLEEGNQQIEESIKVLKDLNNLVVEEGSCGGFLIVLLYGLLGMLGGCRSKLLVVLVALGSMTSLADAACTSAELSGNKVAAQYGMKLYDCDRDKVSQASKDAVYNVIYRGYVAQKGRLSKEYIRGRWARVESAFWSVWKDAPLWQAQIAAAICSKEFLCGVQVKYSEWESWKWIGNRTNNNGTQDCGITQINSGNTAFSCDELQDFVTAFQEQRRIIILKVRNSSSKAVWKKRIHRYNHKTNYEYGVKIWDWSGASFGGVILTFIIGLFRRRREVGQGIVGAEISDDWQKRCYPRPSFTIWAPKHNATYEAEVRIFKDKAFTVNGKVISGCYVIITTIRCKDQVGADGRHKVVNHHYTVASQEGSWQRKGYGDFVPCD